MSPHRLFQALKGGQFGGWGVPVENSGNFLQAFLDTLGLFGGHSRFTFLSQAISILPALGRFAKVRCSQAKQKLARLQRTVSRKLYGSNNRIKAVLEFQREYRKVANIRTDTLHKITSYLAKNHSQIVIEDLNVSGMLGIPQSS